jgi:hypothetical protein
MTRWPVRPAPASSRPARRLAAGARALAVGAVLAVAAWGLPALPAHALDNGPTDPGVRCAAKVGPGQYEFYLPGEKATDVNGNKWVCGPDGQWFRDYSALVKAGTITIGTRTTTLSFSTAVATLQR